MTDITNILDIHPIIGDIVVFDRNDGSFTAAVYSGQETLTRSRPYFRSHLSTEFPYQTIEGHVQTPGFGNYSRVLGLSDRILTGVEAISYLNTRIGTTTNTRVVKDIKEFLTSRQELVDTNEQYTLNGHGSRVREQTRIAQDHTYQINRDNSSLTNIIDAKLRDGELALLTWRDGSGRLVLYKKDISQTRARPLFRSRLSIELEENNEEINNEEQLSGFADSIYTGERAIDVLKSESDFNRYAKMKFAITKFLIEARSNLDYGEAYERLNALAERFGIKSLAKTSGSFATA